MVAVEAFPDSEAVIVPAEKLPLASLATIALAVFELDAVVAELLTLPAVEMVASLVSGMFACNLADDIDKDPSAAESTAPAVIEVAKATTPDPLKEIAGAVIGPVKEKFLPVVSVAALPDVFWLPVVLTPGKSILAEPLKLTPPIFLAVCSTVAVEALPLNAAVIVPAVKFPLASRATIALAVFALDAVVEELSILLPPLNILAIVDDLDVIVLPYLPSIRIQYHIEFLLQRLQSCI